jgi:hypothetical protein
MKKENNLTKEENPIFNTFAQHLQGSYRNVDFLIVKWQRVDLENIPSNLTTNLRRINYYLFIHLGRIPEENDPNSFWLTAKVLNLGNKTSRLISYDYCDHPIIGSIDFHWGITWYSKETSGDQEIDGRGQDSRVIKIGCDYEHCCDKGIIYTTNDVINDVKNSIDSFLALVPEYKLMCTYNGNFLKESEGVYYKNQFYSKDGLKELLAWKSKNISKGT